VGKLEKLVVLTVLFLVAVILGVSLNSDKGVAEAGESPLSIARAPRPPEQAPATRPASSEGPAPVAEGGEPGETAPGPRRALNIGLRAPSPDTPAAQEAETAPSAAPALEPAPEASTEVPAAVEPEAYVVTTVGLQPSLSEDVMLYTWRQGDTFTALAETYYGSSSKVYRLKRANEGRAESALRAGQQILVPVLPDPALESGASGGGSAGWAGGSTYTVQAGDVLGTISQTVYGTSQSWRKIYDANRDQLADPNHLEVGMVLRVPE